MARVQLRLGVGGVLEYSPAEGRPTHGWIAIYRGQTALVPEVALTVDTFSTTCTALAGARALTVGSTAGAVAGRRIWIGGDDQSGYEDSVVAVHSATVLEVEEPLKLALNAARIAGHVLRYTVNANLISSSTRYLRAAWRYTVAGATYRRDYLFDVVRLPFELALTEEDVCSVDPGFSGQIGTRGSWRRMLAAAVEDIWLALESQGRQPDLLRSRDLLRPALLSRLLYRRHFADSERAARHDRDYQAAIAAACASMHAWYDRGDDWIDTAEAGQASEKAGMPSTLRLKVM